MINQDPETRALASRILEFHDQGHNWQESAVLAGVRPPKVNVKELKIVNNAMIIELSRTIKRQRKMIDEIHRQIKWAQDHNLGCVPLAALYWAVSTQEIPNYDLTDRPTDLA